MVTPFLPGDALLFTVGTLTTQNGPLNLPIILLLLTVAGILGHTVNYWIGNKIGHKAFQQSAKSYFQPEASGSNARVLRATRSQNDHAFTVHSIDSNIRSLCGRNGFDELSKILRIQCRRSIRLGLRHRFARTFFWEYPVRAKEFLPRDSCDRGCLDDPTRGGNFSGLAWTFEGVRQELQSVESDGDFPLFVE